MADKELTDEEIQAKLDQAIMDADPEKLTDEELDRRLELRSYEKYDTNIFMDGVKGAAKAVGAVVDYPMGIARAAVNEMADLVTDPKKSMSERVGNIGKAFLGPSNAPTSQDIAQRVGIPDDPIPGTEIPQSAAAGFGLDLAMGVPEAALLNKGASMASRGVKKVLDADQQALNAIGTPKKDAARLIKDTRSKPYGSPTAKLDAYGDYAKENLLSPMSPTEKVLMRARQKADNVGTEIGMLRRKNEAAVNKWIQANADSPEVMDYIEGSFGPGDQKVKLLQKIDQEMADPETAEQVKAFVTKKLDALEAKYPYETVPIDELTKLKAQWQREIKNGKDLADYSIREDAYNFLQKAADEAIDNEFKYGEKYLSGSDLARHSQLKKEYGTLKQMLPNIENKLAGRSVGMGDSLFLTQPKTWIKNPRLQSTIATLPDQATPFGWKFQGAGAAGQMANMGEGAYKEPEIEGFPMSMTAEVNPMEALMYGAELEKMPIPNIEKARRMELLNKHKRILLQ